MIRLPIILVANRRDNWLVRVGILTLFLAILGFAGYLGWEQLEKRLDTLFTDRMSNRTEIFENAKPIADEFPVFGTGPGTFTSIYQLYRQPNQTWAGYLHDDWLETRITFGWVGFSLILLMLLTVFLRWFASGGLRGSWEFVAMIWLALGGALFHAKFDFPFQVYSVAFLFLLLSCILFCLSRKPS